MSHSKRRGPDQLELPLFFAAPPSASAATGAGAKDAKDVVGTPVRALAVIPRSITPEETPAVRARAPRPRPSQEAERAASPSTAPAPVSAPVPAGPPGLRVIQGGGQRVNEPLDSRNAVVRVLVEAGADLLLKRISPLRAETIERNVNKILGLFDEVDHSPELMPVLRRELDELEALMAQTRAQRVARRGG